MLRRHRHGQRSLLDAFERDPRPRNLSRLADELGRDASTVQYTASSLVRRGELTTWRVGRSRFYALAGTTPPDDCRVEPPAAVRPGGTVQREVIDAVDFDPTPRGLSELAEELGRGPSSISQAATALTKSGVLSTWRVGRRRYYAPYGVDPPPEARDVVLAERRDVLRRVDAGAFVRRYVEGWETQLEVADAAGVSKTALRGWVHRVHGCMPAEARRRFRAAGKQ